MLLKINFIYLLHVQISAIKISSECSEYQSVLISSQSVKAIVNVHNKESKQNV